MKRSIPSFASALLSVLLFMPSIVAAQSIKDLPTADQMTVFRARRIFNGVPDFRGMKSASKIDHDSFRFSQDSIDFDAVKVKNGTREHYSIDLKSLEPISVVCKDRHAFFYCELLNGSGKKIDRDHPLFKLFYAGPWGGYWCMRRDANYSECVSQLTYAGPTFSSAINHLRAFANDSGAPIRKFKERAVEWRALTTKPPVADNVRVQRLLAEDAIKNKRPAVALFHYESGLEIDPTWAQGYFNAALIAAELEVYAQAAEHMQSYLELVPDAPDAQSARDQIAIWQYKAKGK